MPDIDWSSVAVGVATVASVIGTGRTVLSRLTALERIVAALEARLSALERRERPTSSLTSPYSTGAVGQ